MSEQKKRDIRQSLREHRALRARLSPFGLSTRAGVTVRMEDLFARYRDLSPKRFSSLSATIVPSGGLSPEIQSAE